MTLFVPHGVKGFVSLNSGSISLRRVLIPVSKDTIPLQALECATRIGKILGTSDAPIELILLHVSDSGGMPGIELPQDPCWRWERLDRSGDVAVEIALTAEEKSVDLIVMSTAGHKGFIEGLLGSLTQQVLRQSPCPLLAVPAR
jgi:hypothetical protein